MKEYTHLESLNFRVIEDEHTGLYAVVDHEDNIVVGPIADLDRAKQFIHNYSVDFIQRRGSQCN